MEYLQLLEPWMIPIVVMICVTMIVIVTSVTKIITTSMKRKAGGRLSENKEFLDALRDFKESIDRRVTNLEAIVTEEQPTVSSAKSGEKKKARGAIEIELENSERSRSRKENSDEGIRLRNMLNQ